MKRTRRRQRTAAPVRWKARRARPGPRQAKETPALVVVAAGAAREARTMPALVAAAAARKARRMPAMVAAAAARQGFWEVDWPRVPAAVGSMRARARRAGPGARRTEQAEARRAPVLGSRRRARKRLPAPFARHILSPGARSPDRAPDLRRRCRLRASAAGSSAAGRSTPCARAHRSPGAPSAPLDWASLPEPWREADNSQP